MAIALESSAKCKFQIKNPHVGHEETAKAEITFKVHEEETQTERDAQPQQEAEEQKDAPEKAEVFDIIITYQAVATKDLMTDHLNVKLVTAIGQTDLVIEYETVQDPKPEILMQAKLSFAKKKIFDFI